MIQDWEALSYCSDPEYSQYNDLKAWLRSQTQDSQFPVTATSHPLHILQATLLAAIYEISDNLDDQISILVVEADGYNIQVRQGDYYRTRQDDWDKMLLTDVDDMSAEECVALLRAAKEEIVWLVNEISRLECYVSVEKQMLRAGLQGRRTVLRPFERKNVESMDRTPRGEEKPDAMEVDSGFEFSPRSPSVELTG